MPADDQTSTPETTPGTRTDHRRNALLAVLAIVLFGSFIWVANLERTLPDVRAPRDPGSSETIPGHALMTPGQRSITQVDVYTSGEWIEQEIADSDWLASEEPGSSLAVSFYGTDLYLLARAGPEAGRAYVQVNGRDVDHLADDEAGSYVNLWAGEAADRPILLASGLAHGEHIVEIEVAGDGELAVSGFQVEAATPFTWAFILMYAGLAGGMFLILRSFFHSLSSHSETVMGRRSTSSGNQRRPEPE